MSGFVTLYNDQGRVDDLIDLRAMADAIAHRGALSRCDSLGHGCSAATLSHSGVGNSVDTYSDEQKAVVLDGHIFNLTELQKSNELDELAGRAEVMLAGYRRHGDAWFERPDGCFAVTIVDLRSGDVVVTRDRFGARPLYFGICRSKIYVASEIKAILKAPGFVTTVNENNLHSAIGFGFTSGPQTLFKNVYKCVPGFVHTISSAGDFRTTDYLTSSISTRNDIDINAARESIEKILSESVRRHLETVERPGVLLSGGVDSALLAHTVKQQAKKATAVSFSAEGWDSDESGFAEEMAGQIGIPFQRSRLSLGEDFTALIKDVIRALEEPTRFENAVAMLATARDAAKSSDAIMTGETADFILGKRAHLTSERISRILKLPAFLRWSLRNLTRQGHSFRQLELLHSYAKWDSIREYHLGGMINCADLVPGSSDVNLLNTEIGRQMSDVSSGWPAGAQYTFVDLRESSHIWVERMEKISAAFGLECLHPFACNNMLKFGLELPNHVRYSNKTGKPAVRQWAEELFGAEIAYRSKQQFAAPMRLWLDHSRQLRSEVLSLKNPASRLRAYLDNKTIDRYLDRFEHDGASEATTSVHVFRMLTFEYWLKEFF